MKPTGAADSLDALRERAQAARDAAERELQGALAALRAGEAQQRQLLDYRGQYEQRYAAQFGRHAAGIDVVRCYQSFMQRLSQAIEQQARAVQQLATRFDAARESLRREELRLASIGKLIERRADEARREAARRERRQADEAAARSASQRPSMLMGLATLPRPRNA